MKFNFAVKQLKLLLMGWLLQALLMKHAVPVFLHMLSSLQTNPSLCPLLATDWAAVDCAVYDIKDRADILKPSSPSQMSRPTTIPSKLITGRVVASSICWI